MKTFCLFVILCFYSAFLQAKIYTVDNTPGAGANFSSLATAVSTAARGDTLILQPSFSSYGSLTLSKRLYIYSSGHASNTFGKDRKAEVSGLTFSSGSQGSICRGIYCLSTININTDSITLQNSLSQFIAITGSNNLIQGNVFVSFSAPSSSGIINFTTNTNTCSNNLILNNYIIQQLMSAAINGPSFIFVNRGNSSNLFSNNFVGEFQVGSASIGSGGLIIFKDSYVQAYNNIFWSNVPNRVDFDSMNAGVTFRNNLTYSAQNKIDTLPGFNYNDTMPQFEGGYNNSNLPTFRTTNNLRLKSNSVGYKGGTDSTDIGIYGRGFNFSFEGNSAGIAVFDDFQILNPVIRKGGTLKVKISGRKPE